MNAVRIGNRLVGDDQPCYVIAEIGINHNGDPKLAKKLIDVASVAHCDAVKFQKRTPEICVPSDQRNVPRDTPWGVITYMEYRYRVEFDALQYAEIDSYCTQLEMPWFASCWDEASVDFIEAFNPPCYKIASASLTDTGLLRKVRATGKPVLLSTGMSTLQQVDLAVETLGTADLILLHTNSAYPAYYEELNLRVMHTLRERYDVLVGYSGHETGLASSVAAVVLGACVLERHITIDRALWGSDHAASLEPNGINKLVRDVRLVETSLGDGVKRVTPREEAAMKKLRRIP